jgi:PBP1b-binding outer membrane lipoprotein LpoB
MKRIKIFTVICLIALALSSCATVLGGKITTCQRTKPASGQPAREIRAGYLILDILLLGVPFTVVDFVTHAIYKPCK